MSVKIRLARRGRKKLAMYDMVIADARAPRDGRFIEKIGTYNPNVNPAFININEEKALDWIMKGAQPTDTARAILSERGVMFKKHLQVGVNKGAISQEKADKKFDEWFQSKEKQNQETLSKLAEASNKVAKTKFEAEKKVNETRAAAIMKRKQDAEAALAAEITDAGVAASEKELTEEAEEAISDQKTSEKVNAEAAAPKEVKTEEVKAKEVKTKEVKTEEVKAKEVKTEEVKTEEVKAKEVKTEEVKVESPAKAATKESDKEAQDKGAAAPKASK
ncbi:30S ribosomal protein S16 [Cyclobacteriaceae bacterium]|nr:30S ribosomal protein S16 [Cyclobacteriaceae bacterium]